MPVEIFNVIQYVHRRIHPQLLPPVWILARQIVGDFQIPNVIQPAPAIQPVPPDNDDVLQVAYEEDEAYRQ